jgi:hypothetical protein
VDADDGLDLETAQKDLVHRSSAQSAQSVQAEKDFCHGFTRIYTDDTEYVVGF